jgi:KDO2-lipid IV(A) lauroyltransferase
VKRSSPPLIVWMHVAATFLMRYVPVDIAHALVGWLTPVALVFAPQHVRHAMANMRQVLGPSADPGQVRRLTLAAFKNYARYMVDLMRLASVEPRDLVKDVVLDGWEHVERAYTHGRGVVVVGGHVGSWDLGAAVWVSLGLGVSTLAERLEPPEWNARVQRIRERIGMKAILVDDSPRKMLEPLRQGQALAVLVDRPLSGDRGIPVTFFGRTAYVPAGAATLALRAGAAILPAAIVRRPHERGYVAHFGEPLLATPGRHHSPEEVQATMQRIMTWLEGIVRRYPDQWYMFRPMWTSS